MPVRSLLVAVLVAFATTACTKTVVLKEKEPLKLSASPPAKPKPPPPPPPPPRVEVKKEKIQVNDKIHFAFNKAVIKSESFGLLDEIAKVINEHPEVLKIRIEGHTDSVGKRKYNLRLSKRRAKAVYKYLVDKGKVDAKRLITEGYGFEKPIADNETDEGRAKNRRVEFNIIERADEETGEAKASTADAKPANDDNAKPSGAGTNTTPGGGQ